MKHRWNQLPLFGAVALFTIGVGAGCGGAPVHREPDEYTGCGGDEQFRLFDDAEPTATISDTSAPTVTMPAADQSATFSPKQTFQWNQDPNDPGKVDGDVAYLDGPGCMACCPQFNTGALTSLHLPAISGDMYDLQFFVEGNYVYRLVTTLQEWAAPDALWQSWRGKTVTVKIYRAEVLTNLIKEGPYIASHASVIHIGS